MSSNCGSWLVGSPHRCDAGNSVHQAYPVDAIAGKPAPTEKQISQGQEAGHGQKCGSGLARECSVSVNTFIG
ncbi:hypothetical protein EJJ20_17985 [Pseudomonas poae]|nr:hypothetical protein EJJ20_17985 [Pseudomonas poae]